MISIVSPNDRWWRSWQVLTPGIWCLLSSHFEIDRAELPGRAPIQSYCPSLPYLRELPFRTVGWVVRGEVSLSMEDKSRRSNVDWIRFHRSEQNWTGLHRNIELGLVRWNRWTRLVSSYSYSCHLSLLLILLCHLSEYDFLSPETRTSLWREGGFSGSIVLRQVHEGSALTKPSDGRAYRRLKKGG